MVRCSRADSIIVPSPNLFYIHPPSMTETIYLALLLWALVFFTEFVQQSTFPAPREEAVASSSLIKCGSCLAGACLTRYDGWFLAGVLILAVLLVVLIYGG